MPDDVSDPLPPPPSAQLPRRVCWGRVRLYFWATLLVLSFYFYGAVRLIREQPLRATQMALSHLPFSSTIGSARWLDPNTLEYRYVQIGGFFYADSIVVKADLYQLWRHHISEVDITGPQVFTGPLNDALAKNQGKGGAQGLDWTITKLVLRRGTLMLDHLAPDLPSIPIRFGVTQPIVLNYIKFNKPDDSPSMTEPRLIEIENVNLVSPFDPLAPVLSFPLIRLRFTYTELWHHHVRDVELVRPVLHLGQDLFWFSDEFKKGRTAAPATGVTSPWNLGHFQVRYGQLAINVFGQPTSSLPFFFETDVNDIRLDQLDKISAKSVVAIKRLDQDYPDYKIKIENLSGRLDFSIPPTNTKANNVVPTVHVDELSWNGIAATNVWSSVTFDPSGIYGKLDGYCEKGYLKGNFEVYYTKGFLWNADLFADQIDCQPIAQKLAGKYCNLTGSLDGQIAVQGRATEILSCKGELKMAHPGLLEIKSVDDLMKRLPGSATALKTQAMKIALEAFRLYPYQTGALDLNYAPGGGVATLKLNGPRGKREFSAYLHPYPENPKANLGDNAQ